MGWIKKGIIFIVGLALLGTPLFVLGILCIGYVILTLRSGKPKGAPGSVLPIKPRYLLAGALSILSLVAFASGGVLSPLLFGALACLVFVWPRLPFGRMTSEVVPVSGTILLRSSLVPFVWHSVAEVKPGVEELARALSSFEGRLIIKHGAVYAHVKTFALDATSADAKITNEFRTMASTVKQGGAYFLPLDAATSANAFKMRISPKTSKGDTLAGPTPDVLVLEASGGFVSKSGTYSSESSPSKGATIPQATRAFNHRPLIWEFLERVGNRFKLPEPDSFSNLLLSVQASRNEPLSERLAGLESSGENLKVKALAGDEVGLSRAQLRAIVSIYS